MDPVKDPVSLVSSLRLLFWSSVGVSALLIYDIIITLDDEVTYFWTKPFSLINLSFFSIRYLAVVRSIVAIYLGTLSVDGFMCNLFSWTTSICDWIIILCMDYIFYLRVRALYSFETHYKRVVRSIKTLYLLNTAITLCGLIASMLKAGAFANALFGGGVTFCDVRETPIGLWCLFWSGPLIYDSILMFLAVYKAYHIRKSLGFRGIELVKLLVFDQAIYFLLVMACSTANIIANAKPLRDQSAFLFVLYVLGGAEILSLQGSRMLIRLKKVAEWTPEAGASLRITSNVTEAEFRTYSLDEFARSAQYSSLEG